MSTVEYRALHCSTEPYTAVKVGRPCAVNRDSFEGLTSAAAVITTMPAAAITAMPGETIIKAIPTATVINNNNASSGNNNRVN